MNPALGLLLLSGMMCASCSGLYLYENSKSTNPSPSTACPEEAEECPEQPQGASE